MLERGVKENFDDLADGWYYNEEAAKFMFMAERHRSIDEYEINKLEIADE